jgi:hypothetical protein
LLTGSVPPVSSERLGHTICAGHSAAKLLNPKHLFVSVWLEMHSLSRKHEFVRARALAKIEKIMEDMEKETRPPLFTALFLEKGI